jgi:hypothetical protein
MKKQVHLFYTHGWLSRLKIKENLKKTNNNKMETGCFMLEQEASYINSQKKLER